MSMNEILAAHYGTNGATKTASAEDLEKQAQYELFTKIAQSNGVDLSKLSDAQVQELFDKTFSKTAGEMPPQFAAHAKGKDGKDGKDGKGDGEHGESIEEKAKKEHEEKKEAAAKIAEADFMGRTMAHAYVNELQKIAEARAKTASAAPAAAATGEWTVELPKVASAMDTLAMHRAFEIVQEFNKTAAANAKLDEREAATKIAQVHTKGLNESIKVASAPDYKAAIELRALETLEAAGYPVNWA